MQASSYDLRHPDPRPIDSWENERRHATAHGYQVDPVALAGLHAAQAMMGDPHDAESRRRLQVHLREKQKVQHALTLGSTVVLRDGTTLSEGEGLTVALIDHPYAFEIIQALESRGIISSIPMRTAWQRSLPADKGPYVWAGDPRTLGKREIKQGDVVSENEFEPRPPPPVYTEVEILRFELRGVDVQRFHYQTSEWESALNHEHVVLNPNYKPPSPTVERGPGLTKGKTK